MENRAFKIAGIKMLIRRDYGVNVSLIDVNALVDDSLSMAENWFCIKDRVLLLCSKQHILYTK